MCSFNIIEKTKGTRTKKINPCHSAWDIYNTVIQITGNEDEAHNIWKKAGHLDVNQTLKLPKYEIIRVA